MMDLNELAIFAKVVEAGGFTAAADALGLPKSTVSRKVSQLESRLGVRLLQRTTRKVKPTELGAAYFERCARILAEAEEAERSVSQEQETPRGLLRVSAPVETGTAPLGALMAEYLELFPQVQLEMDLSNRMVDLVEEGYDIAIRAGNLPDSSLVARRLGTARFIVSASPAYLEQHGRPETPDDLKRHHCLLYGRGGQGFTFRFQGPNVLASVHLHGRFVANNHDVLRNAAQTGLGVAIMPNNLCIQAIRDGSLVSLLNGWNLPEHGIYAVYPSPRHLTPKVRSFVDFLSERLSFVD